MHVDKWQLEPRELILSPRTNIILQGKKICRELKNL